jgi:hypothetical protein
VHRRAGRGLLFELNPRRETPILDGSYEPDVRQVLQGKLKSGSAFYDVDVNIGFFTAFTRRVRVHKSSQASQSSRRRVRRAPCALKFSR